MKKTLIVMLALGLTTSVAFADSVAGSSGGSVQNNATEVAPGKASDSTGAVTTGTTTQAPEKGAVKCDEAAGSEAAKAACNTTPGVNPPSSSTTGGTDSSGAAGGAGGQGSGTSN
jgi:hypothetical protein